MTHEPDGEQVGFRIFDMPESDLQAGDKTELASADVANLVDAMNGFGAIDHRITAVYHPIGRAVGPAFTVKVHPGDHLMIRKAIDLIRPGDVLVIDSRADTSVANVGGMVSEQLQRRGLAGIVIDGAVRDPKHIQRTELPVFARAMTPAPPSMCGPGEINGPVVCGNVVVHAGDIVVADDQGIAVVPSADVSRVLRSLRKVADKEADWMGIIKREAEVVGMDAADAILEEQEVKPLRRTW